MEFVGFLAVLAIIIVIARTKFYRTWIEPLHTSVPIVDEVKLEPKDVEINVPVVPPFQIGQKVEILADHPAIQGRSERNRRGYVERVDILDEIVHVRPYYLDSTIVLSISDVCAVE